MVDSSAVSLRLPSELVRDLDRIADESGASRSSLIAEAIGDYVRERTTPGSAIQRASYTFQHRSATELARIIAHDLGLRCEDDDSIVSASDGRLVAKTIEDLAMAMLGLGWIMANHAIDWGRVGKHDSERAISELRDALDKDGSDKALALARSGLHVLHEPWGQDFLEANGLTKRHLEQAIHLMDV